MHQNVYCCNDDLYHLLVKGCLHLEQIHLGVFNTVDIDYNKIRLITLPKSNSELLFLPYKEKLYWKKFNFKFTESKLYTRQDREASNIQAININLLPPIKNYYTINCIETTILVSNCHDVFLLWHYNCIDYRIKFTRKYVWSII